MENGQRKANDAVTVQTRGNGLSRVMRFKLELSHSTRLDAPFVLVCPTRELVQSRCYVIIVQAR